MNTQNTQANLVALVTGGGQRIGAAISRYLHQRGFSIAIHCYQSQQSAVTLADELNQLRANSACVFVGDLLQHARVLHLIPEVIQWSSRLDLLVNNASLFIATPEAQYDEAIWERLFTIHVKAPFCLSQAAFPHLQATQGSIVNITDIHAEHALKNYSIYCQSKAALAMQTKSLAREFAPTVRVNAVAPGAILWPEEKNALSSEQQQKIIEKTLLKHHGHPLNIAQAVYSLAENPFITAQTIRVDGGRY